MSNSELENIESQIIKLTRSYFDLKLSSENNFIPNISAVPVSGINISLHIASMIQCPKFLLLLLTIQTPLYKFSIPLFQ